MNKRGQMYILAAVLLCIAIYGVMKVTNRLEMPAETNFDFYVENFQGERSYVVDYGFLFNDEESTERVISRGGLLDIFTSFGSGTGIVFAEYKSEKWAVTNYLGQEIGASCEGEEEECKEISIIPSGDAQAAGLSFDIGKKYYIKKTDLAGLPGNYFTQDFESDKINIKISGNDYILDSEGNDKIESIIFQNIDKNYVRVVKV